MSQPVQKLFPYIIAQTKAGQIKILLIVLASFPFYFVSLDLPKQIISNAIQGKLFPNADSTVRILGIALPGWMTGASLPSIPGFEVDRLGYLFYLSGVFLLLVLLNGYFKYTVNIRKGALGERFVQTLRLALFTRLTTATPEAFRHLKPSEAATILKDEVEPIGGFVGDALVQPLFLGGQALTALLFIVLQSPELGLIAILILMVQLAVIPRLRRQQMRLGSERQRLQRAFAGKVGEVVECLQEIGSQGGGAFERHDVAGRLETLYHVRFRLFERKFAVKFLNNLLAQLTPFLFYTIGGYYALKGHIDIGQLVAVIAAYRDLPPPLKELIDWDQQRLDVDTKFQLVSEQFPLVATPQDAAGELGCADLAAIAQADISLQQATVRSTAGDQLLARASLDLPFGTHVAMLDRGGESARTFGHLLGGRVRQTEGRLVVGGCEINKIPMARLGNLIGYADAEPVIFDGSLYDNIVYPLRRSGSAPPGLPGQLDLQAANFATEAEFDDRLLEVLKIVGLDKAVFTFGLARRLKPDVDAAFVARVVTLRNRLRGRIVDANAAAVIEPFDPERYTDNASIGDNILFGVPISVQLAGSGLAAQPVLRRLIDNHGLTAALTGLGQRIATITLEIFRDVTPDNVLFENFALVPSEAFPIYQDVLARRLAGLAHPDDDGRLIGLALLYIEPRHRLGLLDETLRQRLLELRWDFRREAGRALAGQIDFYDPDTYCTAASLRENLLFGLIASGAAAGTEHVLSAIMDVIAEEGLLSKVYRLGMEQPVGYGGRLLYPSMKTMLVLARNLIKSPSILVLNEAFGALSESEAGALVQRIRAEMQGRTLVVIGRRIDAASSFDIAITCEGSRLVTSGAPPDERPAVAEPTENQELEALRSVGLFAQLDLANLKLLAFTSERVVFLPGERLFAESDEADAAYTIISGTAEITVASAGGPIMISTVGEKAIVGEMGIITGEPRSATATAITEMVTLRIRKEVFLALLAEFPDMALSVTRLMVRRLQHNVSTVSRHYGKGDRDG